MEGNEAWADAADPTIGIGTKDSGFGDVATSLFAFQGQVPSLLEEDLALLRGRDDTLQPGVEIAPVYNRLVWNYTGGIASGEVIYAMHYDIMEDPNQTSDGSIGALDAERLYPQGHGDAYGHYLTALTGYYSLLLNPYFEWSPQVQAVDVLGLVVSVNYQDERKFASSAAALASVGREIFDLTWRRDFQSVKSGGWEHFSNARPNSQRTYLAGGVTNAVTRYWGMDQWASRVGQGTFLNWIVGNSLLPAVDPDPLNEGIQIVDRTTVPELQVLAAVAKDLQTALDNAAAGLSPLGLPEAGIAFDLDPNAVVGTASGTHFEQVYDRAKVALNNAVVAFDDAKNVTRLMRSQAESLQDFQLGVYSQELAYKHSLVEIYGSPYTDDVGPGKTWPQGYDGPDLIHYSYVDLPESTFGGILTPTATATFKIVTQTLPDDWATKLDAEVYKDTTFVKEYDYVDFSFGPHGFFDKPTGWTGQRPSPGKLQQAASEVVRAHDAVYETLASAQRARESLLQAINAFKAYDDLETAMGDLDIFNATAKEVLGWAQFAYDVEEKMEASVKNDIKAAGAMIQTALPDSLIVGLANGGDLTSAGRAAVEEAGYTVTSVLDKVAVLKFTVLNAFKTATETAEHWSAVTAGIDKTEEWEITTISALGARLNEMAAYLPQINQRLRDMDDAQRAYRALVAQGDRLQAQRETFRRQAAGTIQGFRTRDVGFRLFRNEKLGRYQALFELAGRYTLLAANAYDYETGLLNTSAGRQFVNRIFSSAALGVVANGQPQYAGSDAGDPGLSSVLAEMKADWDVLRGRLGFNNPDAYGTTVSLRTEALRILPTSDGDANWTDALHAFRMDNVLDDADVRRNCLRIDNGDGLPVPGLVISFSTTISDGLNLFGRQLAAGDHAFSASSFATKIFGVGMAFVGYRGMDNPSANSSAVTGAGGTSPRDPSLSYLDPLALSATPYVYLIPVGVDSMRTAPLGDTGDIRTWSVEDVAVPMPFNIGASDFSTRQLWESSETLTEPMFAARKHQPFRPVSLTDVFSPSLYGNTGTLLRSQFTNNRLVGRSVWNSQWKIVIPGRTLLNDPKAGLDRFLQTVTDIKLHFVTYSYSGN